MEVMSLLMYIFMDLMGNVIYPIKIIQYYYGDYDFLHPKRNKSLVRSINAFMRMPFKPASRNLLF